MLHAIFPDAPNHWRQASIRHLNLNTARRRLDESGKEIKRRNLVAEQKAREAVEVAEEKIRGQVDDAMQEAAQLQARNAALQAQLGDALNDVAVAKVRKDPTDRRGLIRF